MTKDHTYNLLNQLVQENESLFHIRKYYENDSGDCAECTAFWKKMITDKEDHVKELEGLVKSHLAD